MQLSKQAKKELKVILQKELGKYFFTEFTEEMINDLGVRLLKLTAVSLKFKRMKK